MKKQKIKRWITWIVVVAVLAGAGGGGYWWYKNKDAKEMTGGLTFAQSKVTKGTITQSVSGSGAVEVAESETALVSEPATVAKVWVEEGAEVKKGDVLATFEGEDVSLALSKAELTLEQQKMALESAQEKWKSLQISGADEAELESAEMNIKSAELNIKQTELEIQDYKEKAKAPDPLVAPIDGTVTAVNIKAGDEVSARLEAFTIVNYKKLQMTISADELDITKIKVGQKANITLDALSGQKITGTVTEISKEGTSSNGVSTFPVVVTLNNIKDVLPGMSGEVEIIIQQKENALMVPVDAVETIGGKYFVRVPRSGETEGSAGSSGATESSGSTEPSGTTGSSGSTGSADGRSSTTASDADASSGQARSAASGQTRQEGAAAQPGQGAAPGGAREGAASGWNRGNGQGLGRMNSQNGEFTLKEITVGITTDSNVEVLSGLNEGDTVLIPITVSSDTNRTVTMGGFGGMGGFPGAGAGFISGGNRVFSGGGSGRGAGGTSGGTGGGGR